MKLNIKAVAELTGVPLHTLRAWERRYGIPRPDREPGNRYRLYDENDIADVLYMKRQVEAGVSPAAASTLLRQRGQSVLQPVPGAEQAIVETRRQLLTALLDRDQSHAHEILNQAWSVYSPEQVVLNVIQPVMREIGAQWQSDQLSVEQEHLASNLVRQRLLAMIQAQPVPPLAAPRLVAACAPEEQHELGLLVVALLARRAGWNVTYLGQRTPLPDLYEASQGARFALVSVATVRGLSSLMGILPQTNPPPAPLVFGGELFNRLPLLRQHVPGAYLGDDAVTALRQLSLSTPAPSEWKPGKRRLAVALLVYANRIQLAAETVAELNRRHPKNGSQKRRWGTDLLTQPTLFLADAIASTLAFDVPELMDAEGAWLSELLTPRGMDRALLHQQLATFIEVAVHLLPQYAARHVAELLERFGAAVDQSHTSVA